MSSQPPRKDCEHTLLANGIHEFVFFKNSRQAVDDYIEIMERFVSGVDQLAGEGEIVCILVELRESGMPPAAYMANRYRDLLLKYNMPLPDGRVAYLYTSGFVLSMARTFMSFLPQRYEVQRQFFPIGERAEAERWLLGETNTSK